MYLNVKKALETKNISMKAFAAFLGVSEKTVTNKITGVTDFTFPEARRIKRDLLPEFDYEYLFANNEQKTA